MGLEELRQELQAIDSTEFAGAISTVFMKSLDMSEATYQMSALQNEYPGLTVVGGVAQAHAEFCDVSQEEKVALVTGVLAVVLALKELIDTRELNEIPTITE